MLLLCTPKTFQIDVNAIIFICTVIKIISHIMAATITIYHKRHFYTTLSIIVTAPLNTILVIITTTQLKSSSQSFRYH